MAGILNEHKGRVEGWKDRRKGEKEMRPSVPLCDRNERVKECMKGFIGSLGTMHAEEVVQGMRRMKSAAR